MEDISDSQSSKNVEYKISSPHKTYKLLGEHQASQEIIAEPQHTRSFDSPEPSKSVKSKISS